MEIDILDAQTNYFGDAQARAVSQKSHAEGCPIHGRKERPDLGHGKNGGKSTRSLRPHEASEVAEIAFENVPVEENHGV